MFENDEFDEILSGFPCAEFETKNASNDTLANISLDKSMGPSRTNEIKTPLRSLPFSLNTTDLMNTPRRVNIHHDSNPNRKRKFPGPAGLLSGLKQKSPGKGQQIQASQEFTSTQNNPLDDSLWSAMREDLKISLRDSTFDVELYPISYLKKGDAKSKLPGYKVPLLGGMIQSVDYSVPDPILVLKDDTAEIQCLLHRDAWELFSKVLLPMHSVILLSKATVFTVGLAHKKNYINITVNNINTIYCKTNNGCIDDDRNEWIKRMNVNVKKNYPSLSNLRSSLRQDLNIVIYRVNSLDVLDAHANLSSNGDNSCEQSIIQSVLDGIDTEFLFNDFTD